MNVPAAGDSVSERRSDYKGSHYKTVAALLVLAALAAGGLFARHILLRAAGRVLSASDPISPCDAIVVTEWDGEAALLDAADLVHQGVASRVALLMTEQQPADRELARRGVYKQPLSDYLTGILHGLGVSSVELISRRADGTGAEGEILPDWFDQQHLRSVIVVSSPDHSRRVRRVLHRTMRGRATRVAVHTTRYGDFIPDRWWTTHEGVRSELEGLGKLLVDVVLHPIS